MLTLWAWCLAPAFADTPVPEPAADLERFRPAADTYGYAVTRSATTLRAGRVGLGAWGHYDHATPLTPRTASGVTLPERAVLDVQAAIGVHDRVSVALVAPVLLWQSVESPLAGVAEAVSVAGMGDLRVEPHVVVLDPDAGAPLGLGVTTAVSLPTGERATFHSEGHVTVTPTIVAEMADGSVRDATYTVRGALNVGLRVKGVDVYLGENYGPELLVRAAGSARVAGAFEIGADVAGVVGQGRDPVEVLPWLALQPAQGVRLTAGAGFGVNGGIGAPEARVFGGLTLRPGERPPVPPDTDGDGLVDAVDACPAEPEDFDGVDDADGCPEADPVVDTDGDGIPDPRDACPTQPEDFDGVDDGDGCPDADPEHDTDGDGLLDAVDACPFDAEDLDGFEDADGCPEPDNDRDGLLDVADACPDAPETPNGYLDEDGCPDEPPSRVVVTRTALEIHDRIFFELGRAVIDPQSYPLLEELARVILDHPHIQRIRVEGHTDDVGSDAVNLRLSQQRAEAVRDFLVARGVDPVRLEAVGYGESRPIDTNRTERGRARNRRVEFTILEQESR